MRSRSVFAAACVTGATLLVAAIAACGARTGLPVLVVEDARRPSIDAGEDAGRDGARRGGRDAAGTRDAPEEDALDDRPVDMNVPEVLVDQCPDAAATLIYVVTTANELWSFDPPTLAFTRVGTLGCFIQPFSMAVNRHGIAWVVDMGGHLYRVSTATAACQSVTRFTPGQHGFATFGMGFVAGLAPGGGLDGGFEGGDGASDAGDSGVLDTDQLFVASADFVLRMESPSNLGTIDTSTFVLRDLGGFIPPLSGVELTGTGDGRLFAYYGATRTTSTGIAQIDPHSATVLTQWDVGVPQGDAWAFAFWGGKFYLFTSGPGMADSSVSRFDPADSSVMTVAYSPTGVIIDGAGVSTCAPLD